MPRFYSTDISYEHFTHQNDVFDLITCFIWRFDKLNDEEWIPHMNIFHGTFSTAWGWPYQESEQMEGNAKREGSIQNVMKVCWRSQRARRFIRGCVCKIFCEKRVWFDCLILRRPEFWFVFSLSHLGGGIMKLLLVTRVRVLQHWLSKNDF